MLSDYAMEIKGKSTSSPQRTVRKFQSWHCKIFWYNNVNRIENKLLRFHTLDKRGDYEEKYKIPEKCMNAKFHRNSMSWQAFATDLSKHVQHLTQEIGSDEQSKLKQKGIIKTGARIKRLEERARWAVWKEAQSGKRSPCTP